MLRPVIRQIAAEARPEIAKLVRSWGYPREIVDDEIENGLWLCDQARELGVLWFVNGPEPGSFAVHVCGAPSRDRSSPLINADTVRAVEIVGGLLGATRIYAPLPRDAKGFRFAGMRRIFRRFGWLDHDLGPYIDLGEAM